LRIFDLNQKRELRSGAMPDASNAVRASKAGGMRSVSDDADPVLLAHGIAEGSVFYMLLGIVSCTQSKNMSMMLLVAHTYLLQVVGTARCHTTATRSPPLL